MTEEKKKEIKEKSGISRREFLKDAGLVVGGAAIGSTVLLVACQGGGGGATATVTTTKTVTTTAGVSAAANVVKFTVNKHEYEVPVEPNWTLLWVLREKLGLFGVKMGCEMGSCGSCTVLIDGKPVTSCLKLAIECEGCSIETIEGLSEGKALSPVQQAFVDNHAMQCGYCTPGIIMTATALLRENRNPTKQAVREALVGNICRCHNYEKIIASVLAAAGK